MFYVNQKSLQNLEQLFLALSDKTRLRLVGLMANGEVSVSFLAEHAGESQPKISRHLAYLRDCGIVTTRREGKWIYYGLADFTDDERAGIIESVLSVLGPSDRAIERQIERREIPVSISRADEEMEVFLL